MKKWIAAVVTLLLVVGAAGAFYLWQHRPLSPEQAVEKTLAESWQAIHSGNWVRVQQTIDTDALAMSLADGAIETETANAEQADGMLEKLAHKASAGTMSLLKTELVDRYHNQLKTIIKQDGPAPGDKGLIPLLWNATIGTEGSYKGMSVSTNEAAPNAATATLLFADPAVPNQSMTLHIRLQRSTNEAPWKVVGVDGVSRFLQEMEQAEETYLNTLNAPIRQKMNEAMSISQVSKSSGVSQWGVGRGVMLQMAYRNTSNEVITHMEATVRFIDPETNRLLREVTVHDRDGIEPDETIEKVWPMSVNPLKETDEKLYLTEADDLKIVAQLEELEFEDGTILRPYTSLDEARSAGAL